MRSTRTLLATAVLLLSGAAIAHAGTKVMGTPPGSAFYPSLQTLTCSILNLNTSPKNVTVDVMDYYGGVIATGGGLLAPSAATSVSDATGASAWCRFTVEGSTKKYRAAALYSDGTSYTNAHVAR